MKYKKIIVQDTTRNKRIQMIVYVIVSLTIAFSRFLTYRMIRTSVFMANATKFVEEEMVFPNTQVLNHKEYIESGKRYIDVTLIGEYLPKDSLQLAMLNKLDSVGLGGTVLNIKQGFTISSSVADDGRDFDKFYSVMQQEIARRQNDIDSLKTVINDHRFYSEESLRIAPEVKVLFPAVKDLALSKMVATSTSHDEVDTVNMVFVNAPSGLSLKDRQKLVEYVGIRLNESSVHLTLNPSDFPWPSGSKGDKTPAKSGHKGVFGKK